MSGAITATALGDLGSSPKKKPVQSNPLSQDQVNPLFHIAKSFLGSMVNLPGENQQQVQSEAESVTSYNTHQTQKTANVGKVLKKEASAGSSMGSTMLTSNKGVDQSKMRLSKKTLLGG